MPPKIDINKNYLIEEYSNKKRSSIEIAKDIGCKPITIRKRLEEYGIKIRTYSEAKIKDLVDSKFKNWKVVSFNNTFDGKAFWNCECECGNKQILKTIELSNKRNNVKRCKKCIKFNSNYKGGEYITGTEFKNLRYGAKNRNLEFSITIQDIENLYEQQNKKCSFTGKNLFFDSTVRNGDQTKIGDLKIIRGNASVDRINSSKGYTLDNIQIVDKDINMAKQTKSDEDFIKMCCEVADYARNKR
jgi:hypothetical protein